MLSVTWTGEAKLVVDHPVKLGVLSTKKITICDQDASWPEGVVVATDLLDAWELK